MIATLRYWHRRFCDAWMIALIGEDAIDREIRTQRRGWAEVRAAFATDDHRRRTP